MSEKLKSCPFCGEIPHNDRLSGITDCKCGACFMLRNIGLHWNSRPIEDALRARIGELEKEIAPFRAPYFKGLSMEAIAELAKKSIKLTEQHRKDATRIGELEEALDSIRRIADMTPHHWNFAKEVSAFAQGALKGAGK